jgi:hypothetical protein
MKQNMVVWREVELVRHEPVIPRITNPREVLELIYREQPIPAAERLASQE